MSLKYAKMINNLGRRLEGDSKLWLRHCVRGDLSAEITPLDRLIGFKERNSYRLGRKTHMVRTHTDGMRDDRGRSEPTAKAVSIVV